MITFEMTFMEWYSSCHHFPLCMGHLCLLFNLFRQLYISHKHQVPPNQNLSNTHLSTMSAAIAAAAAAAACCSSKSSTTSRTHHKQTHQNSLLMESPLPVVSFSRYEAQKRRDWNTFLQYLSHHRPLLALACCSAAHVLEFLKYLDQFGNTKLHALTCPFLGHAHHSLPAPCCPCPRKQDWGSLDALVGRLRVAFEENGGQPLMNPFAAPAVRLYIRDVRDDQAKARGGLVMRRR